MNKMHLSVFWGLVLLLGVGMGGCAPSQPVLIGFAAQLTGRQSELGIAARNGAQLAVEEINANGGIFGRNIELIVLDDQGDPEVARANTDVLISQGVVAIIGHPTSDMTAAVLEKINQQKIILLSPTSTSSAFTNQDDYFFRVCVSNDFLGRALARYAHDTLGLRNISGVYDLKNRTFTQTFWENLKNEFEQRPDVSTHTFSFTAGETDLRTLAEEIVAAQPEGIFFATSAVDAALLAQYIRLAGSEAQLLTTPWAHTPELIQKGGRSVEGLQLITLYNPEHPSQAYRDFSQIYYERYGKNPSMGATQGYESVMVLAKALSNTNGYWQLLRQNLLKICQFSSIQGELCFNEFGDVEREAYIIAIKDNQFTVIDTILPTNK
jgi:branched-chain amino acid transport system substrate-binding protein